MQFFLYDIVGRIVAACLCLDCYRSLLNGLVERKIRRFQPNLMPFLLRPNGIVYKRDSEPVFYWMQIGTQAGLLLSCLFVAVFGWPHAGADWMQMSIQAALTVLILYIAASRWWHSRIANLHPALQGDGIESARNPPEHEPPVAR